jgi:hypothetical protein
VDFVVVDLEEKVKAPDAVVVVVVERHCERIQPLVDRNLLQMERLHSWCVNSNKNNNRGAKEYSSSTIEGRKSDRTLAPVYLSNSSE